MSADFLQSDRDWTPRPTDWIDWGVAFLVFAATLWLLVATMDMGIPRDESFYFHAAGEYIGWFEQLWANWQNGELWKSFTKANVDEHWSYNSEHPVLMKTLFALSNKVFHHWLEWTEASTALRLPGAATGAATVAVCYLFGRQLFGRLAGLAAAGAMLFQPRFFFHAHLACFDVPITFFWVAVVYAYWRSYDSRAWAVWTGILFGLGLLTKLNAFFLPIVLALHWLIVHWKEIRIRRTDQGTLLDVPPVPWAFVSMLIIGPLMFYALTPRYWFDTWPRIKWYLNFHLDHVHYFVQYFGQNVQHPPLPVSYPWVMTFVTVPLTILVAAGFGLTRVLMIWDPIRWFRRWKDAVLAGRIPSADSGDPRGTGLLLVISLLFPIALISAPDTPIFGGTKHWMTAMPFLAIFAGAGIQLAGAAVARLVHGADQSWSPGLAAVPAGLVATLAVVAPAAHATKHVHPYGTSYYNEVIGGVRGAADHRMFRQFWGYASYSSLDWIEDNVPTDSRLWLHNTTGYAWWFYKKEEIDRVDLRSSHSIKAADYALYSQQKAFVHQEVKVWRHFQTKAPSYVVSLEGVPLMSIYEKPDARQRRLGDRTDGEDPKSGGDNGDEQTDGENPDARGKAEEDGGKPDARGRGGRGDGPE